MIPPLRPAATSVAAVLTTVSEEQPPVPAPARPPKRVSTPPFDTPVISSTIVTTQFKMVFRTIVWLTVGVFIARVAIAFVHDPNESIKDLVTLCNYLIGAGFGAIFALLGGKAV